MRNLLIRFTVIAGLLTLAQSSVAQNSVVVIPLFGDDPTPLQNVITVSPSGGDFTDPVAAINSIPTTGDNVPDSDNPYLIVIGPGEYAISEQLVLQQHVGVTGSGPLVTRIIGAISGEFASANSALVVGTSNSPLSQLTISNTVTAGDVAISMYTALASVDLSHVNIEVDSQAADAFGLYHGVAGGKVNDVRVTVRSVSGNVTGISNNSSPVFFNDLSVQAYTLGAASTGVDNSFSAILMNRARIEALGASVAAIGMRFSDDGGAFENKLADSRVIVSAEDTTSFGYGILVEGASPEIDNVRIEVNDSLNAVGFRSGGNTDSRPVLSHCSIDVSAAPNAVGVANSSDSGTITLRHCNILAQGSSSTVGAQSDTGARLRISHSTLGTSGVSGTGDNRCTLSSRVSTTGSFVELTSTCQIPIM